MYEVLKQLFTGKDNETHDMVAYLVFLSFLVGLTLTTWNFIRGVPFSFQDFGVGVGAMIGAFGVADKLRKDSFPDAKKPE
jgi:hypothetical protein